jgi:hypothetical protein
MRNTVCSNMKTAAAQCLIEDGITVNSDRNPSTMSLESQRHLRWLGALVEVAN